MLQCVCNVHIPVVHARVHVCCAISRVACLCAVWFCLHVGGDLVLRGLLILICVRDLSLRFLFCLFAGLNLFKLTTRATDSDVLLFALVCACNLICLI
jgi:hypothetical protein